MPTVAGGSGWRYCRHSGYMSPERTGTSTRTDIRAFGCVLYEMLTARQRSRARLSPTRRQDRHKRTDPNFFPKTRQVLFCFSSVLNKNRRSGCSISRRTVISRWHVDSCISRRSTALTRKAAWGACNRGVAAVIGGSAAAAAVYFVPRLTSLMRFDLVVPEMECPHCSGRRDDAYITARMKTSLWSTDRRDGPQIAGTEDLSGFLWSPDSKKIAFIAQNKLQKVDLAGGSPQFLGNIGPVLGADWSRAGVILMGRAKDNIIVKIADTGGEIAPVTKLDEKRQETIHALPVFQTATTSRTLRQVQK
jgi:serine/threonine protein kinase